MGLNNRLQIGDVSNNGQVEIVDEDRLCYLVRSISKGATGLRTISKSLLEEYVNYWSEHSDATSESARQALSGTSEIDKYEYGYTSTLSVMAQMVLQSTHKVKNNVSSLPRQQIFYGAPGTGKSFTINQEIKGEDVIRTTFHPDSDYSSFVGAYKPTTREITMRDLSGHPVVEHGQTLTEEKIVYEFVPQAFLQAYIAAWEKYAACDEGNPQRQFLVIEEINRGNCAQIFGDLFQLLDRKDDGTSCYSIRADKDLADYLQHALSGDAKRGIEEGNLCLPSNLQIIATMNTSDQSLFPMDSAFKRRWDWEYIPIDYSDEVKSGEFMITINGKNYKWVTFLEAVNRHIRDLTHSEDKQMGNFFIKNSIEKEAFKSKVMAYLWHEVCKDEYGTQGNFFRSYEEEKKDMKEFSFNELYEKDDDLLLQGFMTYLGVSAIGEESAEAKNE